MLYQTEPFQSLPIGQSIDNWGYRWDFRQLSLGDYLLLILRILIDDLWRLLAKLAVLACLRVVKVQIGLSPHLAEFLESLLPAQHNDDLSILLEYIGEEFSVDLVNEHLFIDVVLSFGCFSAGNFLDFFVKFFLFFLLFLLGDGVCVGFLRVGARQIFLFFAYLSKSRFELSKIQALLFSSRFLLWCFSRFFVLRWLLNAVLKVKDRSLATTTTSLFCQLCRCCFRLLSRLFWSFRSRDCCCGRRLWS